MGYLLSTPDFFTICFAIESKMFEVFTDSCVLGPAYVSIFAKANGNYDVKEN